MKPIVNKHFACQELIQTNYRERDSRPGALDDAIAACQSQIAIAPQVAVAMRKEFRGHPLPRHVGYDQLVVIRGRQGEFAEAIRLCGEAREQGWSGSWDKRIARYAKQLER